MYQCVSTYHRYLHVTITREMQRMNCMVCFQSEKELSVSHQISFY